MCCLFGIYNYKQNLNVSQMNHILAVLSKESEARGTAATGIAYNYDKKLHIYKKALPAHQMKFHLPAGVHYVMGHTRMTTQGSEKQNINNHPFRGLAGQDKFALAHNGVLYNDHVLQKIHHLPATPIKTDSYVAVQLLEKYGELSFDSLTAMAQKLEGSFTITVLDKQNHLYIIRGNNPICLYHYPEWGLFLYASTETILKQAIQKILFPLEYYEKCLVEMGEILKIQPNGQHEYREFSTDLLFPSLRWLDWEDTYKPNADDPYLETLRSMAGLYGYAAEDVDTMIDEGILPEEIEAYFYQMDLDRYF